MMKSWMCTYCSIGTTLHAIFASLPLLVQLISRGEI